MIYSYLGNTITKIIKLTGFTREDMDELLRMYDIS